MLFRKTTLIILMAMLLACAPQKADISSDITDFWNALGGQTNENTAPAFARRSAIQAIVVADLGDFHNYLIGTSRIAFVKRHGGVDIRAGSLSFTNEDCDDF